MGSVNLLELSHIPNNADLQVGDALVTSGLGRRFPPGYPVGKIRSIERDNGQPFAKVLVEPSAQLERNREVLLVWPATERNEQDRAPSPPSPDTAQSRQPADG
jgi:rod shape-determining protein MreC